MDATRCTMNATRCCAELSQLTVTAANMTAMYTPTGCCTLLPTTVQLDGLCDGFQLNVVDMTIYTT